MNSKLNDELEMMDDFIANLQAIKGETFVEGVKGVVAITQLMELALDSEVPRRYGACWRPGRQPWRSPR